MERHFGRLIASSLLSLCIATGVASAQNGTTTDQTKTTTQTTNQNGVTTQQTTTTQTTTIVTTPGTTDINFLTDPNVSRVYALQTINDIGLSTEDMIRILPLLRDLRDARQGFMNSAQVVQNELLVSSPGDGSKSVTVVVNGASVTGPERLSELETGYNDRVSRIWQTISDKVGSEKADRLHALVDTPVVETPEQTAYWNGIHRIDKLLVRWDALSAQRMAAQNNGGQTNTTQQTTVETVIEPTPVVPLEQPAVFSSPPYVSPDLLVEIISDKLIAMNAGPYTSLTLNPRVYDLYTTDFTYLRNRRLGMWK